MATRLSYYIPTACVTKQLLIFNILQPLLTLPAPIPDKEKNLTEMFSFTLLCGASKSFMTTSKEVSK